MTTILYVPCWHSTIQWKPEHSTNGMVTFDINALQALSEYHDGTTYCLVPFGSDLTNLPNVKHLISPRPSREDHPRFHVEKKKILNEICELDKFYHFDTIIFNPLITREIPEELRPKFVHLCHGNFSSWGKTWMGIGFQKHSREILASGGSSYCVGSKWLVDQFEAFGRENTRSGDIIYNRDTPCFSGSFNINTVDPLMLSIYTQGDFNRTKPNDFIFVGTAIAQKNIKMVIKLKKMGFPIKIFTTIHKSNPQYLKDHELEHCIIDATRETILKTMLESKYLVFPSKFEASGGIVSFEGASAGCKVIYTTPAPKYYLDEFEAGVFVPELNITEYAKELENRLNLEYSVERSVIQRNEYMKNFSLKKLYYRLRQLCH